MNTIKKIRFALIAALGLLTINSCVKDDDWSLPPVECNNSWETNMSMEELFNMVDTTGGILSFDTERIIEGYVVSSDSTGNFFKTVSIQNSPSNPTRGLQVEMDRTNLYNNFPVGSRIQVNLKGLNVGYDRGMLKVGSNYDSNGTIRVGRMAEALIDGHVKKTCDAIVSITPQVFNGVQEVLNGGIFNTLVTINGMQFADSEMGQTYADAAGQQTVNRKIVDENDKNFVVRNSGYATFAGDLLPTGSGSITVVLSAYDSNNNGAITASEYQLFIRDTNDVNFNNPRFGDGGGPGNTDFVACLNEGFESYTVDNSTFPNYENIAKAGTRKWQIKEFGGNKYIQMGANGTTGQSLVYFIVPVDFSNADKFSFKTKAGYNNGAPLKVYYSTSYTPGENIDNANLQNITSSFTIATGPTTGYDDNFTDSGEYSLASLSGNGVIVFAYEGSGTGVTTTMQIDDIKITDNEDPNCNNNPGGPGVNPPSASAVPLFAGHNFEDWSTFLAGINSFGIKSYATQGVGKGLEGSASLHIEGTPTANDYVFTNLAPSNIPANYSRITFYIKGTSAKSVSLNVYKADGTYYSFNLASLSGDASIQVAGNNQYTGTIDTGGNWALVELDLSGISDLNLSGSGDIFALKVGKEAAYNLDFDNFTIE